MEIITNYYEFSPCVFQYLWETQGLNRRGQKQAAVAKPSTGTPGNKGLIQSNQVP